MKQKFFKDDLLNECRILYNEKGISAFLYKNIDKKLYFRLYQKGIRITDVIAQLGLRDEYKKLKKEELRWNWDKIIDFLRPIVIIQNFLPPAAWFQGNGYSFIVAAVYSLNRTWDDLRIEFNSYENSTFVVSRNGMRWLSHPEASLSNFLYSRGIEHYKGKRYPEEYSLMTGGYADQIDHPLPVQFTALL
ncbi:MAG TPA: hypothetical protein PLE74_12355, partial [Candidatus Cloacimonadota bacterium]|nr:hypothetical protein [Candidatus Cloacimonadota bacterium]